MGAWLSIHRGVSRLRSNPDDATRPSGKAKVTTVSLGSLPHNPLLSILHCLNSLPEEPEFRTILHGDRKCRHRTHPLDALSLSNKYLRDLCLPLLYEEILLKGEATHMLDRFAELSKLSDTKHKFIKSLSVVFDPSHARSSYAPSEDVYLQIVHFLSRLENLQRLVMIIVHWPKNHWLNENLFQINFPPIKLIRVHTLQMEPFNPLIWNMCPNVVALSTDKFPGNFMMAAMAKIRDITSNQSATGDPSTDDKIPLQDWSVCSSEHETDHHDDTIYPGECFFKLKHMRINSLGHFDLTNDFVKATPHLESLDLITNSDGHAFFCTSARKSTNEFISKLPGFKNLKHLRIPHDGPNCMDDYEQQGILKSFAFACPSLEDITLGGVRKARILMNSDGSVSTLIWLGEVEEVDIFAGSRTRDHHPDVESDTANDLKDVNQATTTAGAVLGLTGLNQATSTAGVNSGLTNVDQTAPTAGVNSGLIRSLLACFCLNRSKIKHPT